MWASLDVSVKKKWRKEVRGEKKKKYFIISLTLKIQANFQQFINRAFFQKMQKRSMKSGKALLISYQALTDVPVTSYV